MRKIIKRAKEHLTQVKVEETIVWREYAWTTVLFLFGLALMFHLESTRYQHAKVRAALEQEMRKSEQDSSEYILFLSMKLLRFEDALEKMADRKSESCLKRDDINKTCKQAI